jgi:hypothetical protein
MTPKTERMLRAYLAYRLAPVYAALGMLALLALAVAGSVLWAVLLWIQQAVLEGK